MADVVSPEVRSRMMSGIRAKNTRPEMAIRRGLHALGFRFRLHVRALPGSPDLVFPKWRAVIFVHGCFWHGHDCPMFRMPQTRRDYWEEKIGGNRRRDAGIMAALAKTGWRRAIVWECALKGARRIPTAAVLKLISDWLRSDQNDFEIAGTA